MGEVVNMPNVTPDTDIEPLPKAICAVFIGVMVVPWWIGVWQMVRWVWR